MLLPDLRVKNYRLFKEFAIERLAQVNLIAGGNNTGKSSLLEIAYLMANENVPSALDDVLRIRGENGEEGVVFPLFYGYRLFPGISIEISSGSKSVKCSIPEREEIKRLLEEASRDRSRLVQAGEEGEPVLPLQIDYSGGEKPWWFLLRGEDGVVSGGFRRPFVLPPGYGEHKRAFLLEGVASLYSKFKEMRRLWDSISLTAQAGEIVEALKIIEPNVRGVDFLRAEDKVKVLVEGEERPVLIGSLGDGMRHLLMIALLLVSARNGVLLVDEIDTGLHYTVMVDLWRLVFRTAERSNVQVLATTHSWDCIAAFSHAWNEAQESEGLFLRLDRKGEYIQPVLYTREELGIAVEQRIETR
jgi:hypothetical protein